MGCFKLGDNAYFIHHDPFSIMQYDLDYIGTAAVYYCVGVGRFAEMIVVANQQMGRELRQVLPKTTSIRRA
jgi:hypothetical protein